MTEKERFTVDSDGNYWDKINHRYVNLDYLFILVEELDAKLDNKQHTINEMAKTIRIYDDGYIDLNKKYKKVVDENEQLKQDIEYLEEKIKENEWHWNTIDEDRDVWHYKCTEAEKRVKELKIENEQLKDFIKKLADDTGRIILRNGYGYHISKVINDD